VEEFSIDSALADGKVVRLTRRDLIDTKVVSHTQDIQLGTLGGRQLLYFTGPDPQIHFALGQLAKDAAGAQLVVILKMVWPGLY
jgi:hypothetical protein